MSLRGQRVTTVSATGVGRKDYSRNIEYSVEKVIRSLQERFFYSYTFTNLGFLAFPNVYESALQFLVDGVLQYEAPSQKPWMFYLIEASTQGNHLCGVTFNRYLSYTDFLNGNIYEHLGTAFGFVDAKLELTKGIPSVAGSVYSIQYGQFSGIAFNMDLVIHGLIGAREGV